MAGIFGLRPEDDPFLMDKLNRHKPLQFNVVDEPTDPRVEPPENEFFKRPELIPRPPAGAATEPLVKPMQPFEVAADPAITRNPSPSMPKVLPPTQEAAPIPDALAPPKAQPSLMDRPAQAPVPVRPTAEYQAPHVGKGRTIAGVLAGMFRPTAGLSDYLLNDPYRRADTAYSNQLKKQSDFDTTIKQGYEARQDQRAQAGDVRAEQAAEDVHQKAIRPPGSPQTITTDKGIMGWNDATGNYDRPQGQPAAKTDTSVNAYEDFRKGYPDTPTGKAQAASEWQKRGKTSVNVNAPMPNIPAGASGEDVLKTLQPAERAMVKKLANYEVNPQAFSTKGGHRERLISLASIYDPTYDMTQYSAKAGLRKDFTSGKAAGNIRALNTAVGHLGQLNDAVDALNNGDIQFLNKIGNKFNVATGGSAPVVFNSVKNAVTGELAATFKGTGATDQEITHMTETLGDAQSPQQVRDVVKSYVGLLNSRLHALQEQYDQGMGKPADFQILHPESSKTIERLTGGGGEKVKVVGPDGKQYMLPRANLEKAQQRGYKVAQ